MAIARGNLFDGIPGELSNELIQPLVSRPGVRVERIVSYGQASEEGFWYDQEEHEWVIVLQGTATLQLAAQNDLIHLGPGDWLEIPAHQRHRVESTAAGEHTIWLAVFFTCVP